MHSFRRLAPSIKALSSVALLCLVISQTALGQDVAVAPEDLATTPVVQNAEWAASWWMPRHEQKLKDKEAMEKIDMLWIGDSITHGWEEAGKATWEKLYTPRNAFNIGFSGDRTEHVLWRLENGEVEGISPKLIVMMIGTNNTGHRQDAAELTAGGIKKILEELDTRLPESKVLLLGVFPRGETKEDSLRKINVAINEQISTFADDKKVFFLDISDKFLDDEGVLPKDIMPDLLHPNEKGYEVWAESIEESVEKIMK